jgi:hypothetical protein
MIVHAISIRERPGSLFSECTGVNESQKLVRFIIHTSDAKTLNLERKNPGFRLQLEKWQLGGRR